MKRLALALVVVALLATPATASAAAQKKPSLSQACLLDGKEYGSPKYLERVDHAFRASSDAAVQAVVVAHDQYVQADASSATTPPNLRETDPYRLYCRAHYPVAYYKGSRVVARECDAAVTAWAVGGLVERLDAALGINASNDQEAAAEVAMMTACGSRSEWLNAATQDIPQENGSGFGKPSDIYKSVCDPEGALPGVADTLGCRNK
jgi:opacity protein-like surface antigen